MSPKEVLEYSKKHNIKQLDLRFSDIPALQHHVSYPITELSEESFTEGFGMDGSSIRGWAAIKSDMLWAGFERPSSIPFTRSRRW